MHEMSIRVFVQHVLKEWYAQSECELLSLNTRTLDDDLMVYKMYRVNRPDSPSWVVFAAHDALMEAHTFRWGAHVTPLVWLERRALMLNALASQGYPLPHVICARTGESVVRSGSWSFLMTTFHTGQLSQFVPEAIAQVGTLLARLHTLPLDALPSWPAWWDIAYSIPHAIQELERVSSAIPPAHQTFYQACYTTLHTILHVLPTLPDVLIHGDCWMQNAVVTSTGVVLIDWESAGRGAAVMDLADFLLRSQCNMHGAPPNRLHEHLLTAAISGYVHHRLPSEPELDLLLDAMRFSVVWRAAWMFAQVGKHGWNPRLEQGIARVHATYDIAEPTACFARSAFQKCGSSFLE